MAWGWGGWGAVGVVVLVRQGLSQGWALLAGYKVASLPLPPAPAPNFPAAPHTHTLAPVLGYFPRLVGGGPCTGRAGH